MELKKIGKNIQIRRKELKLTQAQLAEMVDISITHLTHIETGVAKMSLSCLVAISDALKTTPDYLLLGKYKITSERAAHILDEKIRDLSTDEIDYIFEIIDHVKSFKVIRK